MSLEADYITSSELDPESASEWCESKSDTEREDPGPAPVQRSKRPTRKQGRKSNFKAPPSISTPPSATAPPSIPRSSPSIPSQYQVPNDQDKYRDLPDYMPYMPRCVPQALPTPLFQAQTHQTTAYKMEPLMQQHRFASDHLLQGLQGAGQHGFTVNRSQGAGQFDFTTCKSFQGAGISFQSGKDDLPLEREVARDKLLHSQHSHLLLGPASATGLMYKVHNCWFYPNQFGTIGNCGIHICRLLFPEKMQLIFNSGIKRECQPGNSDLLMDYSGMGLSSWFDPSTGQFRPQYLPQPFDGHDFDFDFAAAMPFALSDSQVSTFRPCILNDCFCNSSCRLSLFSYVNSPSHVYPLCLAVFWRTPSISPDFSQYNHTHIRMQTPHDRVVPSLSSRSRPHCTQSSSCRFLAVA